jgi:hypothetical protein
MVLLARDPRVPKQLRWVAGIGLVPIPGPIDEAVLVLIAPVFVIFYREPMREAWQKSFQAPDSHPEGRRIAEAPLAAPGKDRDAAAS